MSNNSPSSQVVNNFKLTMSLHVLCGRLSALLALVRNKDLCVLT